MSKDQTNKTVPSKNSGSNVEFMAQLYTTIHIKHKKKYII